MNANLKTKVQYNSETRQNFVAVSNAAGHGCDVYANEVVDWEDGNGILAHGEATEQDVRSAAAGATTTIRIEYEGMGSNLHLDGIPGVIRVRSTVDGITNEGRGIAIIEVNSADIELVEQSLNDDAKVVCYS